MSAGFGRSMWCVPGIGIVTGRFAGGRTALAQSILRRLQTPRGALRGGRDEERFGIDLPGYVGATDAALAVASLPGVIRAELLKDDRIAGVDARVTAAQLDAAVSLVVEIDVAPADETGDFTLTAAVDAVSLTLIGGLPA